MIREMKNREKAAPLFGDWKETIIWSCLQGTMGHVYGDHEEAPTAVAAMLGDFCFFAGEPDRELISFKPEWQKQDVIIAVPQNRRWAEEIERHYGIRAKRVTRYAMKKEPEVFDRSKLEDIVKRLPSEYTLSRMDEPAFAYCKQYKNQNEDWCGDLVSQFPDDAAYEKLGLGVIIRKEGIPVSGASSYSAYRGGIEIEIDTKKEYRRKGLALVCGAKLILECLDRNLYPSWDAQNRASVALAEKLGYHFDYEYDAYEIYRQGI